MFEMMCVVDLDEVMKILKTELPKRCYLSRLRIGPQRPLIQYIGIDQKYKTVSMESKIKRIVMKAAIVAKGNMCCLLIGFLPGTNHQEMENKIQTCHDYMMKLVKFKETNPTDEDIDKYLLEHPLPDYTDLENMLNVYLP
jgi:hypothetical protein